jgi:L-alanine-DL-glutamate epimerase and related enzymes of enolase superfamily
MKISDIEIRCFRIPLLEPLVSAKFRLTHRELVTVRVETDEGVSGLGWSTTPAVGAAAASRLARDHMVPLLLGQDPRHNEALWTRLWEACHYAGPGGITTLAISAIDIALWDLRGRLAGEPLYRLLGASRERIGVYASGINLHLDEAGLLKQIEGELAAGYEAFKIKLGRPAEEDLARCRAVRKLIGPNRELMLDANQKWGSGEAVQRCAMLAEVNPLFIEEPLLSDDVAGHARLCASSPVPVAVGEQLCNKFEFWNYVREGAADVLQPCVWKVGGITEWMKVAVLAQCANLPISPHGAMELSVHLACAIPNSGKIENIMGVSLFELGAVPEPLPIVNGCLEPPQTPGHGIEIDVDSLSAHEVAF